MARYNEILVGRFARAVQKLFGVKGEVPIASLAGELSVVHPVINGVENRWLEGWDRFGSVINVAAGGAGNRAAVRLRNPANSNVLAVVEKFQILNVAGLVDTPIVQYDSNVVDFAVTTFGNIAFDARGRKSPTLIGSGQGNAGASLVGTQEIAQISFAANVTAELILTDNQELTLLPTSALTIFAGVLNQAVQVNLWWRERYLEESERS